MLSCFACSGDEDLQILENYDSIALLTGTQLKSFTALQYFALAQTPPVIRRRLCWSESLGFVPFLTDVIHTVGPVAKNHVGQTERDDLASCYKNSLMLMEEHGLRTVVSKQPADSRLQGKLASFLRSLKEGNYILVRFCSTVSKSSATKAVFENCWTFENWYENKGV